MEGGSEGLWLHGARTAWPGASPGRMRCSRTATPPPAQGCSCPILCHSSAVCQRGSHQLNTWKILALRTPRKAALWKQWMTREWLQPFRTLPWYSSRARRGAMLLQLHLGIAGGQSRILSPFLVPQTGGWPNSPFNPPSSLFPTWLTLLHAWHPPFLQWKPSRQSWDRDAGSLAQQLTSAHVTGASPTLRPLLQEGAFMRSLCPPKRRGAELCGGEEDEYLCSSAGRHRLTCSAFELLCKRYVLAASLSWSISSLGSSSAGMRQGRSVAGRINSPLPSRTEVKAVSAEHRLPTQCPMLGTFVSKWEKQGDAATWFAPTFCSWLGQTAISWWPPGEGKGLHPTDPRPGPVPLATNAYPSITSCPKTSCFTPWISDLMRSSRLCILLCASRDAQASGRSRVNMLSIVKEESALRLGPAPGLKTTSGAV